MLKWLLGKSNDTPPAPNSNNTLRAALSQTSQALFGGLFSPAAGTDLTPTETPLSEAFFDRLEEALIRADLGLDSAVEIVDKLRDKQHSLKTEGAALLSLKESCIQTLQQVARKDIPSPEAPLTPGKCLIYLVVGVNGAGKTTFIGKLAHRFVTAGKRVVIGAGDTFRAAAEDQLAVWAERAGATLIRQKETDTKETGNLKEGDPAAVIYDALQYAKAHPTDVLLLDTAGRLQNKFNLMEELRKIQNIIEREKPDNSHVEAFLVLDASTGQNALKQAQIFQEAVPLTGAVLTKLDGSAKGGIVFAIATTYQLPVVMVGLGEGITDLKDFSADDFIDALFNKSNLETQTI